MSEAKTDGSGFQLGLFDVGQDQLHALMGGAARQFQTDSAGSARSDCRAVAE